jgi:hypothetical protein
MRKFLKTVFKRILQGIPILSSLLVFLFLFATTFQMTCWDKEFGERISSLRTDIITISGILSGIIIAYLTSKVLQIRQEKIARLPELKDLTQKLHRFRSIVDKLIHSNLWVNGLSRFVDVQYKGLTYYDVNEISFVDSKITNQASQFISDHTMGDTANLYLELKTFTPDIPFDRTLYSEFEVPVYYSTNMLEKWITHECGGGLYYYFDHKYGTYKGDLRLDNVYIGYQEDILKACLQIDRERYHGQVFDNKLLSKLGTQVTSDILPRLYRLQLHIEQDLPTITKYLFIVLLLLILFGVLMPLLIRVYNLNIIFDIISLTTVLTTSFYLMTSFYRFLKREVEV